MPITPVNFTDAPAGWEPGDELPADATPLNAAALENIQAHVGDYADDQIAAETAARTAADNALDGRIDALEANHEVVCSQVQPAAPTVPTLWIALDTDNTPLPVTDWQVFIP